MVLLPVAAAKKAVCSACLVSMTTLLLAAVLGAGAEARVAPAGVKGVQQAQQAGAAAAGRGARERARDATTWHT